jgi:hypothetical protein
MKRALVALTLIVSAVPLAAQTADEIIAKFITTTGGAEKIAAVTTLKRTGKYIGGGGFEAVITQENKRPDKVREDFIFQGLDGINAWDGKRGWKIDPFSGKKDVESLSEEEMASIIEDSDFDGPLVNYRAKGNKVEFAGMEPVEGTDAYKLKLTMANGETRYYFMDTDYYVPIKIETKRMVRGAERTYETSLGDYKEVNGWYLPWSLEVNAKGSQNRQKYVYDKIEANVSIDDARFSPPVATTTTAEPAKTPDASEKPKGDEQKKETPKPPQSNSQAQSSTGGAA